MAPIVPKKFYRHALKAVTYYSRERKRPCSLQDITAYMYLKNQRAMSVDQLQAISKKTLAQLCTAGIVKKVKNQYWLNELGSEDGSRRSAPIPNEETVRPSSSLPKRRKQMASRRSTIPMDAETSINTEERFYEESDESDYEDDEEENNTESASKSAALEPNQEQSSTSRTSTGAARVIGSDEDHSSEAAGNASP
ncbi:uncharacterized protein LOC131429610 [Malaya genurostris]|uniref:uncharacterized protein LOC131429610 n=1 Tax=Malaya genurostris TaxID=325434 RepID=UPI0026F3ACF7|nr:uncharacterized protein LOC131429610 [Malaya genurostris]XP_058449823.1 uncharacterized protein LOC131429610 [Malaya genurostris]